MELDLGPEIAEFRAELRDWIAAEAPAPLAGLADWNMPLTAGGRTQARLAEAEAHPAYAEWAAKLAEARLVCPQWPEEFGGQGMDAVRGAVLNEEFYRAGVPRVTRGMGEWLVGPSVMVHGTPEQRAYFLPRIISYEDFLDGVRTPLFFVIGGLNHGWRVAMTTLGHERGGRATVAHLGFEREFWQLTETARKRGKTADPLIRQQLAWAYTQVELMRFSGLRTLAQVAAGRPPGPEASVAKLFWSEYHKRLGEIAMTIEGADGLLRPAGDGYPVSAWQSVFLSSRAGTIYSGTSEIQRNIIGERALGLPKETGPKEQP